MREEDHINYFLYLISDQNPILKKRYRSRFLFKEKLSLLLSLLLPENVTTNVIGLKPRKKNIIFMLHSNLAHRYPFKELIFYTHTFMTQYKRFS